jgi:very-short-patch-repair endonuclease
MTQNSIRKPRGNEAEQVLAFQCLADGLTDFEQEYVFCASRKYRLDLAFPTQKVGIEIDGSIFSQGAHSRPLGIMRDMLVLCGWRVLRYTPQQVRAGDAIEGLKALLIRRIA